MAANRKPSSRSNLIHCENCGEYYSDTYRRCPFCDEYNEYEDDYDYEDERPAPRSGGGKRLTQPARRGGGYTRTSPLKVISIIISLAVILLAAWIVVTKFVPLIQRGDVGTVDPNANTSQTTDPDPDSSSSTSPDVSDPGPSTSDTDENPTDVSPAVDPTPAVNDGGATGFTLSKSEFAISDRYPDPVTLTVTFTPAGTEGTITWTSSDPDAISVDENGTVSAGTKRGSATITATLSNGVTQTCTVYNQLTNSSASGANTSQNTGTASGTYTVNNPDFTLYRAGETYQLKVTGYTGSVTWTSSNTSIATVGSDGTVTAAGSGKGSCTVTGTLDNGATVKAIVRIDIS